MKEEYKSHSGRQAATEEKIDQMERQLELHAQVLEKVVKHIHNMNELLTKTNILTDKTEET